MKHFDVDVIIPVYNNPGVINSIESILTQDDYYVSQIIVVNDGSKDNTIDVVKEYKYRNNIENLIIVNQDNKGPSAARNNGINHSKAKYIAFLDSDDIWESGKLKKQVEVFEKDKSAKLVSTTINGRVFSKLKAIQEVSLEMLLFHNYFTTSTVIMEKSVLDVIGNFNEDQKYSEDYDLWLRIIKDFKCVLINESFVTYGGGKSTFGVSGLSAKLWLMEKGELSNYKRLFKNRSITLNNYMTAYINSFAKYLIRSMIVMLRKKC